MQGITIFKKTYLNKFKSFIIVIKYIIQFYNNLSSLLKIIASLTIILLLTLYILAKSLYYMLLIKQFSFK